MFYAHFVLSKKGPLARIWLAAHWDKKLTKAHVFETNIESSVEGILQPKVKMALRTSGHLLLGVVRIYSRKAKYLLADCNEAFIKIKMAFRPGVVDLPEENREAALNAITLPEVFHDFDTAMPELNDVDVQTQFTLNQSRAEEITMREDYGNITLVGDDGFGDMGFEDNEIVRDATNIEDTLDQANLLFSGEKKDKEDGRGASAANSASHSLDKHIDMDMNAPLRDDGFGGGVGEGLLSAESGGLFEPGGLFDDAPLEHEPMDTTGGADPKPASRTPHQDEKKADDSDDDDDYYDVAPPSMGAPSSGPSSPASPEPVHNNIDNLGDDHQGQTNGLQPPAEQTTLIQNEEETFALAPLEASVVQGTEKSKTKRKRKLIIDEVKNISGEEMKSQLADTSDIVTTLDLAPPTKRLMHWKETGGVEKLFALPGRPIPSKVLSKLYQRHLTTRAVENEEIGLCAADEDKVEMEPENVREEESSIAASETTRMSRKRRLDTTDVGPEQHLLETPPQPPPLPVEQQMDLSRVLREDQLLNLPLLQPPEQVPPPPPPRPRSPSPPPPLMQPPLLPLSPPQPHQQLAQEQQLSMQQQPPLLPPPTPQQSHLVLSPHHLQQPQLPDLVPSVQPNDPQIPLQIDDFSHIQPMVDETTLPLPQPGLVEEPDVFFSQQQHQIPDHTISHDNDHMQQQPPPYNLEDDDDMECPVSVGPPDEQGADETYEQFEERVLNKRAQQMLFVIQRQFARQGSVKFSEVARNATRKQVAQKFYTFLVLKKQQAVELYQEEPFSEITITPGPKLNLLL